MMNVISILKFIYQWRSLLMMFFKSSEQKPKRLSKQEQIAAHYNEIMKKNNGLFVETHPALESVAQQHAEWMAKNKKLSHIGVLRLPCFERCKIAGYEGTNVAEYIFVCKTVNAKTAIDHVMGTKAAKSDIIERFRYIGVGSYDKYWCIILGR